MQKGVILGQISGQRKSGIHNIKIHFKETKYTCFVLFVKIIKYMYFCQCYITQQMLFAETTDFSSL